MGAGMTASQPADGLDFDLLLKGGQVIDPANGVNALLDVAITGGKIARVAPGLSSASARKTIDVTGLYVTPGLLDIHTHVYPFVSPGNSSVDSVRADAHLLASGVTTTVDAGTTGWKHFLDFKEHTIDRSRVRILAFLNIACQGMVNAESEQTPAEMDPRITASLVLAFPETLVGVKSAHYWTSKPWDEFHPPWASVDRGLEAASLCGKPLMVDFWPRPPERTYPDLILKKLRPGDIHTHVFAQQFPILSSEGKVNDFLWEARQRGVHFDLGHGAASFWFRNAVPAFRQGFVPDSFSTDLHMANINGPVVSLQNTLSKYLAMGLPIDDLIRRATVAPARAICRPDLGTLTPGAEADVAVFQMLEGHFSFADCGKTRLAGSQKLECQLTLRSGEIVFDPSGLSMQDWDA